MPGQCGQREPITDNTGRGVFRTFVFGILLGFALAAAALHFLPAVNQHREASLISVQANGGTLERFRIELPEDRILAGGAGAQAMPAGLDWPASLADTRAELYKVRNERGIVIGVASRLEGREQGAGELVEWALHLPARGTMFLSLRPGEAPGDYAGRLRAGTREFSGLTGSAQERVVPAAVDGGDESNDGRIELLTARTSTRGPGR